MSQSIDQKLSKILRSVVLFDDNDPLELKLIKEIKELFQTKEEESFDADRSCRNCKYIDCDGKLPCKICGDDHAYDQYEKIESPELPEASNE